MPAPLTGQTTATSPGAALSTTALRCEAFILRAPTSNVGTVYIGPAGVTHTSGYALNPGDSFEYERHTQSGAVRYELSVSDFYVANDAVHNSDIITWFASPSGP